MPTPRARIVDAILDWRDPDDLRRPNGAEAPDYRAAGPQVRARQRAVRDGRRVRACWASRRRSTRAIVAQPHRLFAPGGHQPRDASRDVLLALPDATPEAVDTYHRSAHDALEATSCRCRRSRRRRASAPAPSPVWRIRAEATLPDGVTFAREAVRAPVAATRGAR